MLDRARSILFEYIGAEDRVAVALSGGMDSMCLLKILIDSKVVPKQNICALHVNHGIRGEDADKDNRFVMEFCKSEGIEFICVCVDVPRLSSLSGKSLETVGREERRRQYRRLIDQKIVDKVLLAHHLDDQAETILMHVFRGSGLAGLRGMRIYSDGILRPLLSTTKAQIEEYVIAGKIPYVTDCTNSDSSYNRNYLRNEILPKIKQRWQGVENSLANLAEAAREADTYILSQLNHSLIYLDELQGGVVKLDVKCFEKSQPVTYYILDALKKLSVFADVESKHIMAIKELVYRQNGAKIDLTSGIQAAKEYDKIAIYKTTTPPTIVSDFGLKSLDFGQSRITIRAAEPVVTVGKLTFDLDKIPSGAIIRSRKDGDIFKAIGGGTKKLKDYLIDKKIPQRLRDSLACVCHQNEVLLIFGVEIGEKIKLSKTTTNAACAEITPI